MKIILFSLIVTLFTFMNMSFGQTQAPNLRTTAGFALFTGNGALANSGASVITGDVGTNVGAITGFGGTTGGAGTVNGSIRTPGSTESTQAAADVTAAYNSAAAAPCGSTIAPELGGQTLVSSRAAGSPSGVFCQNTASPTTLNGTLTLSGDGIFIIKLNSALVTGTNSMIVLTNGATPNNVFFQIMGAATLGTGSTFQGTILALGAIVLGTQASLTGRALSTTGAITLNNNVVTNVAAPLPVSLVSFTAKPMADHTVYIAWTTSLEFNNKGFVIERSKDLKSFDKVGEVSEIAANSQGVKNYTLTDLTPYAGTSYYRLKQTDLNGKTTNYPAVSVVLRDEAYGVFPNPSVDDGRFALRLDEPETATVGFFSVDGRSLPLQKTSVQSGNLLLKTMGKLPTGVYVLTVEERGQTRQHRLVVE